MFEENKKYMNLEKGKMEHHHYKKRFWKRPKTMLIITFLAVLFIVAFTSLPGFRGTITGNAVNEGNLEGYEGISISADLTIPNMSASENFKKITIEGLSNSLLEVGNQKVSLPSARKSPIVLEDYEGQISFDNTNINLNGKASRILINNVPISSNTDGTISIKGNFEYYSLKIDEFSIDSLNYETSGKLTIDGDTKIVLNNEQVVMSGYKGNLEVRNKHFKLKGLFTKLDVKGDRAISFSSNN